jgi:hypothetical protein
LNDVKGGGVGGGEDEGEAVERLFKKVRGMTRKRKTYLILIAKIFFTHFLT